MKCHKLKDGRSIIILTITKDDTIQQIQQETQMKVDFETATYTFTLNVHQHIDINFNYVT